MGHGDKTYISNIFNGVRLRNDCFKGFLRVFMMKLQAAGEFVHGPLSTDTCFDQPMGPEGRESQAPDFDVPFLNFNGNTAARVPHRRPRSVKPFQRFGNTTVFFVS